MRMSFHEHPIDAVAHAVGGRSALAKRLGVTAAAIGNWKMRGIPVQQCVAIERATGGLVTRKDLRPDDWADIWPELANSEANPAEAPAPQAQAAIKTVAQGAAT